jgi:hypothetical protein
LDGFQKKIWKLNETTLYYLKQVIQNIKKCDYINSAKVDVTFNHDVLDGRIIYKEYNISIRIKEK